MSAVLEDRFSDGSEHILALARRVHQSRLMGATERLDRDERALRESLESCLAAGRTDAIRRAGELADRSDAPLAFEEIRRFVNV